MNLTHLIMFQFWAGASGVAVGSMDTNWVGVVEYEIFQPGATEYEIFQPGPAEQEVRP